MGTSQVLKPSFSYEHRPSGIQPEQAMNYIDNFAHFRTSLEFELSKAHAFIIVENYYNTETVEQFVMFVKWREKLMFTLYNDLTSFS